MRVEILLSMLSLVVSCAVFAIAYLVYRRDIPTLDTQIHIIPDDNNDLVLQLRKAQQIPRATDGFFLYLQIANSSFRTITAFAIVDEYDETIIPIVIESKFGCTLTEGGVISHMSDISKHGVGLLRKAKKLYIKDTASRKHPVKEISGQQHLNIRKK